MAFKLRLLIVAAHILGMVWCSGLQAADYPSRPVRVIVQYAPGGNVDVAARAVSRQLSQQTGQQFVVDNRAGANGSIAYQTLAGAAPDGYTLGIGHIGQLAINPAALGKVPYDPLKDFSAIGRIADAPNLLVTHAGFAAKNVTELVAYVRANPGKVASGTAGVGAVGHLAGEMLSKRANIQILQVPYKGSALVLIDLMAGNIQIQFGGPPALSPHVATGKLRALAITAAKRSPAFPDLPTVAESGYPGFEAVAWMGIIAPAGLNKGVVDILNREIRQALKAEEVKRLLEVNGFELVASTPAEFAASIRSESIAWGRFIKERGIRAE